MKLWQKEISTEERIIAFTTGMDPQFDLELAPYDIMGSMAHAIMLGEVGLIGMEEAVLLLEELSGLYEQACNRELAIEPGVEDIHSQVEKMLTETLGDTGKKIHTGRSRNDQVMVDIKLFLREEIHGIAGLVRTLAQALAERAEQEKDDLYDEAVKLVIETNQASVSILQRRMRLGYTRAARLIDMMEQDGLVGPYCGSKPRDILVDRESWLVEHMKQDDKQ